MFTSLFCLLLLQNYCIIDIKCFWAGFANRVSIDKHQLSVGLKLKRATYRKSRTEVLHQYYFLELYQGWDDWPPMSRCENITFMQWMIWKPQKALGFFYFNNTHTLQLGHHASIEPQMSFTFWSFIPFSEWVEHQQQKKTAPCCHIRETQSYCLS